MRNVIIFIILAILFASCSTFKHKPSVCDGNLEPSLLCAIAVEHEAQLEEIGAILIVANAVAIGEGLYTRTDALKVLRKIQVIIDQPISYVYLLSVLNEAVDRYPGLFEVADLYLEQLDDPRIMSNFDRRILQIWIAKRIRGLETWD